MTDKNLVLEAKKAMANSYSPYSNFPVGAALVTKDGQVFHGQILKMQNMDYRCVVKEMRFLMLIITVLKKMTLSQSPLLVIRKCQLVLADLAAK